MPKKDYYIILGVSRYESPVGIQKAYKDLALRYHLDRIGPQGTKSFQEINEAYQVLSDPVNRAEYDRVHGSSYGTSGENIPKEPIVERTHPRSSTRSPSHYPMPEPMISKSLSIFNDFEIARPSFDNIFNSFRLRFFLQHFKIHGLPLRLSLRVSEAPIPGLGTNCGNRLKNWSNAES